VERKTNRKKRQKTKGGEERRGGGLEKISINLWRPPLEVSKSGKGGRRPGPIAEGGVIAEGEAPLKKKGMSVPTKKKKIHSCRNSEN